MVMVGIISALWLRERVTTDQIWGTFIMFGGAYFIATKGLTTPLTLASGDTLLLGAAFFGALSTNVFKRYLAEVSPQLVVLMRNFMGAILNLTITPFVFGFQHNFEKVFDKQVFSTLVLFSLLVIVGAQFLWYKSVELIPASKASSIGMTSPLFGVFFAMLILRDSFTYYHLVGGILIIAGLMFATLHVQNRVQQIHLKVKQWIH